MTIFRFCHSPLHERTVAVSRYVSSSTSITLKFIFPNSSRNLLFLTFYLHAATQLHMFQQIQLAVLHYSMRRYNAWRYNVTKSFFYHDTGRKRYLGKCPISGLTRHCNLIRFSKACSSSWQPNPNSRLPITSNITEQWSKKSRDVAQIEWFANQLHKSMAFKLSSLHEMRIPVSYNNYRCFQ